MFLDVAVVKVPKYGVSPAGDTVEVAERPGGGLSVVLVDGQGSGPGAKNISGYVATKAGALIAEGVRDGAAARAVHDYLYAHRRGKVQASLTMLSADLGEGKLVLSRNTECPALFVSPEGVTVHDEKSGVIGVHRMMKPVIQSHDLAVDSTLIAFTDGILNAGRGRGNRASTEELMGVVGEAWAESAHNTAHTVLDRALEADGGRAGDDMAVVVLKVEKGEQGGRVREMHVRYPVGPGSGGIR